MPTIDLQRIHFQGMNVSMLRIDQIHPEVSGNKWFKLKYNIEEAQLKGFSSLLTFGGAYSNHIVATAAAGKENGLSTIGIIRGEEHLPLNPTLALAKSMGMQFHYMDRETYRAKNSSNVVNSLKEKFRNVYLIPEGGSNDLAVKGTEEIISQLEDDYDYICCPVGTGGTMAGLVNKARKGSKVLGFAALKGDFLLPEVERFIHNPECEYEINSDYHFGGYAKANNQLIDFINDFKQQTGVPLDPIYTGKMLYGVLDLYKKDYFGTTNKIVVIHTGGLQGIAGFNSRYKHMTIK